MKTKPQILLTNDDGISSWLPPANNTPAQAAAFRPLLMEK